MCWCACWCAGRRSTQYAAAQRLVEQAAAAEEPVLIALATPPRTSRIACSRPALRTSAEAASSPSTPTPRVCLAWSCSRDPGRCASRHGIEPKADRQHGHRSPGIGEIIASTPLQAAPCSSVRRQHVLGHRGEVPAPAAPRMAAGALAAMQEPDHQGGDPRQQGSPDQRVRDRQAGRDRGRHPAS